MQFTDYLKNNFAYNLNESRIIKVDLHQLTTNQQINFEILFKRLIKKSDYYFEMVLEPYNVCTPWKLDDVFVVNVNDNYEFKDVVKAYYDQYAKEMIKNIEKLRKNDKQVIIDGFKLYGVVNINRQEKQLTYRVQYENIDYGIDYSYSNNEKQWLPFNVYISNSNRNVPLASSKLKELKNIVFKNSDFKNEIIKQLKNIKFA